MSGPPIKYLKTDVSNYKVNLNQSKQNDTEWPESTGELNVQMLL